LTLSGAWAKRNAVKNLLAAFKYLTIWRHLGTAEVAPATVGAAMIYFPAIGLLLGLILALTNLSLAPYVAPEILSMIVISALAIMTGANHLAELKNIFTSSVTTTKSDHAATVGLVAIVLVLLFKDTAIDSIDEKLPFTLLLAPALARWAILIFVYGYQHGCDEWLGLAADRVRFWHLVVATVGTLSVLAYGFGRRGLWAALALSLFVLSARTLLYRLRGRLTLYDVGAMIEIGETLSLILLASL
jgi:adenosylcobinamide-GDP ribazoletransferase